MRALFARRDVVAVGVDLDDIEGGERHPLARRLLAIATTDGALVGSFMCALARLFIQRPSNSGDIHEGSANASTGASARNSGEGRGGAFWVPVCVLAREDESRIARDDAKIGGQAFVRRHVSARERVRQSLSRPLQTALGAASENPFRGR